MTERACVLVLCLASIGCSAPSTEDAGAGGGGGGIVGTGGGGSVATGGGGGAGGGGGTSEDGGQDAGLPGSGDAGTACTSGTDCGSGNCVAWFRDAGAVCGRLCFDQTQCDDLDGFVCIPARDGSGVCVPRSPAHCLPCDFDVNCGGLSEACVLAPGDTVMTCRVDCSLAGAAACPSEYSCAETRFNGVTRSFCTPPLGSCSTSQAGFCERWAQPQPCSSSNDAGTCVGARTCVSGRFTTCGAQSPQCKATCETADRPDCTEPLCPSATQVPAHCGDCNTACPGAGAASTNVTCADGGCTFSCQGEHYDADARPDSGCEVVDAPLGNHQASSAAGQGSLPCNDSSVLNASGNLPSDTRLHQNPGVTGFATAEGAAPDFLSVSATGGTFCVNDMGLTFTVTGAPNLACYRLTVTTDKGQYTCSTNAAGTCSISEGSGSYSGGTTISLDVERTCPAAAAGARYTISGHF